jgi:hypothetical protein
MARISKTERPQRINVSLLLYPSRHQAVMDYLGRADGLSRAAKVINAITVALTGGALATSQEVSPDEVATMLADMEGLFS